MLQAKFVGNMLTTFKVIVEILAYFLWTQCTTVWTQYRHSVDGQTDGIGVTISRSRMLTRYKTIRKC